MSPVPNRFPILEPSQARIAIVGEASGRDEEFYGEPFVGPLGKFLTGALETTGLVRGQCFLGNVCQQMPFLDGRFESFEWSSEPVQNGIKQLCTDLERFKPTIVLCLGNASLHLFRHGNVEPPKRGGSFDWPSKIGNWRGSLFESKLIPGLKCLATFHPAAVLREFKLQAYVKFDLERLREQSRFPKLRLPERRLFTPSASDACDLVKGLSNLGRTPIAVDIEGGPSNITSIAFAVRANWAFNCSFAHADGTSFWEESEEIRVWEAVKDFLENPGIPKIFQNGLYDCFCLAWGYGIVVRNFAHDTRLAFWELYSELRTGLATQASILTLEPYYKPDKEDDNEGNARMIFESDERFWQYNCLDAAVTLECWEKEMARMSIDQRAHYFFNMSLQPALLYMGLRGLKFDKTKANELRAKAMEKCWELQAEIDKAGGKRMELESALQDEKSFAELVLACLGKKSPKEKREISRYQLKKRNTKGKLVKSGRPVQEPSCDAVFGQGWRDLIGAGDESDSCICPLKPLVKAFSFVPASLADCDPYILESAQPEWDRIKKMFQGGFNTTNGLAQIGELSTLLKTGVNIGSTSTDGDAQRFLYETCGFAKVTKRGSDKVSTGQDALTSLYAQHEDVRILWCLQQRRLRTVISDLSKEIDSDSRIRCAFNLVKETGRMSASKSPLGTGTNLQAWNRDLRHVCVADEYSLFYQCDLEGADSWTVAANCAKEGDVTMLEDLQVGLKPAKVLALLSLCGESVSKLDREGIKTLLKTTEIPSWLYHASKCAIHGTSYGMGWKTLLQLILKGSLAELPMELSDTKPVVLSKKQAEGLQSLIFLRYPGLKLWHARVGKELISNGKLQTSAGHVRLFFGRKAEWKQGHKVACHETLKEALAALPQFYTTYATKLALWRLWFDSENRHHNDLIVEPLLCVHDSLLTQAAKSDSDFARGKMREWFGNELEIAGQKIMIPTSGTVGTDWGMKESEKL